MTSPEHDLRRCLCRHATRPADSSRGAGDAERQASWAGLTSAVAAPVSQAVMSSPTAVRNTSHAMAAAWQMAAARTVTAMRMGRCPGRGASPTRRAPHNRADL
jgi:hypothetical protein